MANHEINRALFLAICICATMASACTVAAPDGVPEEAAADEIEDEGDSVESVCEPRIANSRTDDFDWEPTMPVPESPEISVEGLTINVVWAADVLLMMECAGGYNGVSLDIDGGTLHLRSTSREPHFSCDSFETSVSASVEVCGPGVYDIFVDGQLFEVVVE